MSEALGDGEHPKETYYSTMTEEASVIDTVIHQESAGMSDFVRQRGGRQNDQVGAHSARETPVPIPNTAVKPRSGYNTWGPPLGK